MMFSEFLLGIAGILLYLLVIYPWWKIFERTGKPKWLAFLMGITPVNVVLLYWFAFTRWEIKAEGKI